MIVRWAGDRVLLRRDSGFFRPGEEIPEGYFSEAEIADLLARGRVTVEETDPPPALEKEEIVEPEKTDQAKAEEPAKVDRDGRSAPPVSKAEKPKAEEPKKRSKRGRKKS